MKEKGMMKNEQGFVLVVSMVMLLLLTLLGIWALTTSSIELQISGNQQRYEQSFNVAEGGANFEATNLGFTARPAYQITDPGNMLQDLTTGIYNDSSTWPAGCLVLAGSPVSIGSYVAGSDPANEYRYFVTYLYPDVPPKGYDATMFSAYKFRIDGEKTVVIELGGIKVGVKASM